MKLILKETEQISHEKARHDKQSVVTCKLEEGISD